MTITTILVLFHLLISLIAGEIPFSGCSQFSETSQSICRFACFDLRSTFIDAISWSAQLFWPIFYWLKRLLFSKIAVNLTQCRGTVGIFNSQPFVYGLKHKSLTLLSNSHSNVFYVISPHVFYYYPVISCSVLVIET